MAYVTFIHVFYEINNKIFVKYIEHYKTILKP